VPRRPSAATVVLVGALACILGGALAPSSGSAAPAAQESQGDAVTRLLDVPFADPGFYVEGERRFIYATGYDESRGFTAFRVAQYDAGTGRYGPPQPSMVTRPRWVGPRGGRHARGSLHMWGPHVWKRSVPGPRDYVMYFSASRRGHADCLGMATADSPMGPFAPRPYPLRCGNRGSTLIDPAHFVAPGGRHYVVYKRKRFAPRAAAIWALAVDPDGTVARHARPFRLVDGGTKGVEAPSVVTRRGRTYLFASRHSFDSCAYKTVVYVSGKVQRPFRWFATFGLRRPDGRRFCGAGGAEVAKVGGVFRMVFHAFDDNPKVTPGAPRFAWGVPLRWTASGRPYAAPAPSARFAPRATVRSRTKAGSSSFSPYRSRS
jgi:hypothetical protein